MKNKLALLGSVLMMACALFAGCEKNDNNGDTKPGEYDLGDGSDSFEITSDMTLSYPNTYTLKGFVYVTDGATLTIEPGVVIKGDKETQATLIIERGAKLMAQGTKEKPIVFTSAQKPGSRKPGDWGGIIILGKAPNNAGEMTIEGGVRSKHGGTAGDDNSGVLKYVRCEFAGIEYSTDNEINGITFGSVGSGTTVDYVQVSYCGDDSFEWFGGTVNCKHLVSYCTWDDDFDTDNGFSGMLQYGVVLRNPKYGDKSASNGFESDNNSQGTSATPATAPVFSNFSIFGPVADPAKYTDESGVNGSPVDSRFQAALHLRRNTELSIFNSIIAAFPIGLMIENSEKGDAQANATNGKLNVKNCVMAGMVKNYQDAQFWDSANKTQFNTEDEGTFAKSYFENEANNNSAYTTIADLKLSGNPLNLSAPNMFPAADSPLTSGADWTNAKLNNSFFDKTAAYVGAFSATETVSNNWMTGWTNFDPQNTVY